MLRIDLAPLEPGVHHVALEPTAQDVDLDPEQFADIHVDVLVDYHHDRAFVRLTASAVATLLCDRTLASFEQPLEGTHQVLFAPPPLAQSQDPEATHEVQLLLPTDQQLDLTHIVRDTLMLAVPARKLAPGAATADLQTVFGEPQGAEGPAIDPRWEALRALRADNDSAAPDGDRSTG